MIVWAEVVPPFANAMRLINGQQLNRRRSNGFQEFWIAKSFGSNVNHRVMTASHVVEPLVLFGHRKRAIDQRGGNTALLQRVDLIFHQGDQRRNDDG